MNPIFIPPQTEEQIEAFLRSGTGTCHAPWQTNDYNGAYAPDDFHVSPSFTLNIGLRWDFFGWFRERYHDIANFDFAAQNPQVPFAGRVDYFGPPSHPGREVFPAHTNALGPRSRLSNLSTPGPARRTGTDEALGHRLSRTPHSLVVFGLAFSDGRGACSTESQHYRVIVRPPSTTRSAPVR